MTSLAAARQRREGTTLLAGPAQGLSAPRASPTMRLLLALGTRLARGGLVIELPDGRRLALRGAEDGTHGAVRVRRQRVARRLLVGGAVGFAESYMDGDWETPDLAALLTCAAENEEVFSERMLDGRAWTKGARRLLHALRANTRNGSRRNIASHYDLGNAFYARWLDAGMTYSAGLFEADEADLASAQRRKYARLAARLELKPGQHVLEIGCGWGAFCEYLAGEIGCRVTAVTISQAQHDYASARLQRCGLGDRVEVRLQDYRDVEGSFDGIVSVEMLEAVGERYWPVFFDRLRDRLRPGAKAGLQVITIADRHFETYREDADFIQTYIFPGGMLPAPAVLRRLSGEAGLEWREAFAFGPDYARTLAIWRRRFGAAWPEIALLGFDARFRRMWEFYLAYCEAGFQAGAIDVSQIVLARG